jgi:hypothetical protein
MNTFPAVIRTGAAVALLALAAAGCAAPSAGPGAAFSSSAPAGAARAMSAGTSPASPARATSPASPVTSVTPAPASTPTGTAVPSTIVGATILNPDLTSTGGRLYLRWDLTQAQQNPPSEGLARVDPATGRFLAVNTSTPGSISAPAYGAGALWVTDSESGGVFLIRLNPQTLAVTGQMKVTSGNYSVGAVGGSGSHIAFAGGLVWADGVDQLIAVTPSGRTAQRTIAFPQADNSDVTASADGSTLIVSEAISGAGTVQRRDPATGALLGSVPMAGVVAPMLADVTAGGTWISEPTGMMGYVERFGTAPLKADSATRVEGSNGIRADLWDGDLWVTNQGGGPWRNYCADPATGRRLATSPLPDLTRDHLMTVADQRVYYSVPAGSGFQIRTVPVPAACG